MKLTDAELDDLRKLNPPDDPRLFRRFLDTIDALTQTIAELTAKLDAVRWFAIEVKDGPLHICSERCECDWQIGGQLLSILDAPTKPKEARNGET